MLVFHAEFVSEHSDFEPQNICANIIDNVDSQL